LLGFTHRTQVDEFLKSHGVGLEYSPAEVEKERDTLGRLRHR